MRFRHSGSIERLINGLDVLKGGEKKMKKLTKVLLGLGLALALLASPTFTVSETASVEDEAPVIQADPGGTSRPPGG